MPAQLPPCIWLAAAVEHGIRYPDLKIDVAPNAIETLMPERIRDICDICDANNTHVGGEWMVAHAGYHFTSDVKMRMEAVLERLNPLSGYVEEIGITLLLENMNWEPDDAEVHYLGHNVEEPLYYVDRLDTPRLRWAFTANHAHLVEEGVEGFLANMDIRRRDEVRLADCWRNGKQIHLRPGEGDFDFPDLFKRLDQLGFNGHYMNAFGSLQDMIEGREALARMVEPVS